MKINQLLFGTLALRYFKLTPKIILPQRRLLGTKNMEEIRGKYDKKPTERALEDKYKIYDNKSTDGSLIDKYKLALGQKYVKKSSIPHIHVPSENEVKTDFGKSDSIYTLFFKVLVAGSLTYASIYMGIWGSPEDTTEVYKTVLKSFHSNANELSDYFDDYRK